MDSIHARQQILLRIAGKFGHAATADKLGITPKALTAYLKGYVAVPDYLLLKAVDVAFAGQPDIWQDQQSAD